jgi:hypothetical protein
LYLHFGEFGVWVLHGTLEPEESHITKSRHFAFLLAGTNAVSPTRSLVDKPAFDAPTVGIRSWQQSASHLSQAQLRRGAQHFCPKQSIFCFRSSSPICRLSTVWCVPTLKGMPKLQCNGPRSFRPCLIRSARENKFNPFQDSAGYTILMRWQRRFELLF